MSVLMLIQKFLLIKYIFSSGNPGLVTLDSRVIRADRRSSQSVKIARNSGFLLYTVFQVLLRKPAVDNHLFLLTPIIIDRLASDGDYKKTLETFRSLRLWRL